MMAVNEARTPNLLIWGQTVAVAQDSHYHFSAFISSWVGTAPSRIDVIFNGVSVGTMSAPSDTARWVEFALDWNSGSATSLAIELRNFTTADIGGYVALDDITLSGPPATVVAEPSTLRMGLTGVGLVGCGGGGLARERVGPPGRCSTGRPRTDSACGRGGDLVECAAGPPEPRPGNGRCGSSPAGYGRLR
jgi:hypothetical protein